MESKEQNLKMWKLRMRYASKILSHEMNMYANKMLEYANSFINKHTREEIKQFVLYARSKREDRMNEIGDAN